MTRPTRAWLALLALSATSTVLAASGITGAVLALSVLALAGAKAHLILSVYLRLAIAPRWLRGFDFILALLVLTFGGLSLAA